MSIRPLAAIGLTFSLLLAAPGCGFMQMRDAEVSGRVQLSGAGANGHGGVRVEIPGQISVFSNPDGSYLLKGIINGDDSFTLVFTKDGYQMKTYTGSFQRPKDVDATVKVEVPTITLST